MTSRTRFLNACKCLDVDHPPIWFMRQAGRALPEYRSLREQYSFEQLIFTPALAAEVTLQPIRRFRFDAAIIFSDILIIPAALGQQLKFSDSGGIKLSFPVNKPFLMRQLQWRAIHSNLLFLFKTIKLVKSEIANEFALIGFAGSPWTIGNFMFEGGSSPNYTQLYHFFQTNRHAFDSFMQKLSCAVADTLILQIEAGVDAVQIFDSLASLLNPQTPSQTEPASTKNLSIYEAASGNWIAKVISKVRAHKKDVPIIVYCKDTEFWQWHLKVSPDVISLPPAVDLGSVKSLIPPNIGIQGNLDPQIMTKTPADAIQATVQLLNKINGRKGYIFNLGHGLPPESKIETIEAVITQVREFKWRNSQ